MKTTLYDLAFEIDGDDVTLEQSDGIDDPDRITLHRSHVELIAGRMGLPTATRNTLAEQERKIAVLADRLTELIGASWFRSQIAEYCPDGPEIIARLDAIDDLAIEFDGGRLIPSCHPGGAQESPQDSQPHAGTAQHTTEPKKPRGGPVSKPEAQFELDGLSSPTDAVHSASEFQHITTTAHGAKKEQQHGN